MDINYLLDFPVDYDINIDKEWPLMLFLHGAGERGDGIEIIKKHEPPKIVEQDKIFPFILASPQCLAGAVWNVYELNKLIDKIIEKFRVNKDSIYKTGLSMDGYATWALAIKFPDKFAAIAPVWTFH